MPTIRPPRPATSALAATAPFARILQMDPLSFLNHLFQFTAVRLIVRGGGISLCRWSEFGIFHPLETGGDASQHDPVSGLTLNPALIRRICYLPDDYFPGTFELEFAEIGFSLALCPEQNPANEELISTLLSASSSRPVSLATLQGRGASDWLDEGFSAHGEDWRNCISYDRSGAEVDIRIESRPLSIHCRMHPVLADRDEGIIRLSDTAGKTVLHFDCESTVRPAPPLLFHRL